MASAAGAFLNEGIIRSGYSSPVDVFDHSSLGRLTNCLVPFNYGEDAYGDDVLVGGGGCYCYGGPDEGSEKISIGTGGYPPMMMELFDHHSSFCDDSFLDLNVFDSDFTHEPEMTTTTTTMEVEGHAPPMTSLLAPHSNSSYHPSPASSSSSSSFPHISFPSSPDINAFLLYPDEGEEEEEEDVYSSSHEDALRNIPIFVATGRVSEDEGNNDDDDDDDDRKAYSRLGAKVKVETDANSYNKRSVIPRTIINARDSSTTAPKRVRKRKDQLWYFLLEILGDPEYNPNYIQWENKDQGIFRFIESKKVAQLWGEKKKRSGMSYEYFARAMRHYYSRGIMRRVTGRRLVYQFGPKAENWRGYAQQVTIGQSTTRPLGLDLASVGNDVSATTGRGGCCR